MVNGQNIKGPEGIAVAKDGTIYVSNSGANNISVYHSNGRPASPEAIN
jgi:hypothetical protein